MRKSGLVTLHSVYQTVNSAGHSYSVFSINTEGITIQNIDSAQLTGSVIESKAEDRLGE